MTRPSVARRLVALTCLALGAGPAAAAVIGVITRATHSAVSPVVIAVVVPAALISFLAGGVDWKLASLLPEALDGWFARRRIAAVLWCVLAVAAVANNARLGVFMVDRDAIWASAFPPNVESAQHECLPAYVEAGELAAQGHDDLWDRSQYTVDPYEYPPPFAVIGRAAAEADYDATRAAWFGIQTLAFLAAVISLGIWIGGRAGGTAILLAPALALSMPVVFALQYGQAHLIVIAAAVASLPLFARDRHVAGGALLGFAIATKLFPALLLVVLAVRRQWRAVGATVAAVAVMFAVAVLVLGPGTMVAFVTGHLPELASGAAFPNALENYDNFSLFGLVIKLRELGLGGDADLAGKAAWIWGVVALALTVVGARRWHDRAGDAILWLGVLVLATLRSPFAPTYTVVTTLWLLTVWAGAWNAAALVVAWLALQGLPPIFGEKTTIAISLLPQAIVIAAAVLAVVRRPHELRD